jgi:two-component system cell cycle sensor histidine kinase/response regulator CckA
MPTILLVDDEPIILAMITLALEPEGFRVLTAASGTEAIEIFESHRGKIGLLVTDMMMPEMDGPTLASKLLAQDPGLPVLFMSGHYEAIEWGGLGQFEFLAKPFPLSALVAEVRSLTRVPAASQNS